MNDKFFYADVDLPFHVWVREQAGTEGFRWVLREASHLKGQQGTTPQTTGREPPPAFPSG